MLTRQPSFSPKTTCCFPLWVQGRQPEALSSFAEDVYYCSLEYGPEDPRTSLGFYNMGKVGESWCWRQDYNKKKDLSFRFLTGVISELNEDQRLCARHKVNTAFHSTTTGKSMPGIEIQLSVLAKHTLTALSWCPTSNSTRSSSGVPERVRY